MIRTGNNGGGNATTGGNRSGGRGPQQVTMIPTSQFREMLRDRPNRKMRRIAAKLGITAAPKAVQA
jgi:hypothetical protein